MTTCPNCKVSNRQAPGVIVTNRGPDPRVTTRRQGSEASTASKT